MCGGVIATINWLGFECSDISPWQCHFSRFKALALVSLSSYFIYGGEAYEPQDNTLQLGIDILVGTPGRILDHVTRGSHDLSELRSVGRSEAYTV